MFDLTREINLNDRDNKLYKKFQCFLYLAAFFLTLYLSYLIIFPHKYFSFSFLNPTSNQNSIASPASTEKNGMIFDTNITGDYSNALVTINLNSSSEKPGASSISLRKSYQSFLYPEGAPIGWRTGSLLKNNGSYYLVSDSKMRKFSSSATLFALGYTEESFQTVSTEDLAYNQLGAEITATDSYPNSTLFRIENNYYILNDQKLQKFVSDQAYLSKYDPREALVKDPGLLGQYPTMDDLAGFADGTLVANGDSVFIISSGNLLPVDNVQTFENKGYSWNDVLNVGEDEIAIYQKAKLFNIKSPHPDGTIFKTSEDATYYMIENNEKHLLPSTEVAASWLKKEPIMASQKALDIYAHCNLKKKLFSASSYSCKIPLDIFYNLAGFTYEFSFVSDTKLQPDSLSVDYKKDVTKANLKTFILNLYNSIKLTYAPSTTN